MNKLTIIGNLTRDPETRTSANGIQVCYFTVAVNRRKSGEEDADFFSVTAFRQLAENCGLYLAKGKKVAVTGSVSLRQYDAKDGTKKAVMEVLATEVEFLSPVHESATAGIYEANKRKQEAKPKEDAKKQLDGGYVYIPTNGEDELPF